MCFCLYYVNSMRGIHIYVGDEGELGLIPHIHMWDCSRCIQGY